jgi:hypothetical protein
MGQTKSYIMKDKMGGTCSTHMGGGERDEIHTTEVSDSLKERGYLGGVSTEERKIMKCL